MVRGDGLTRTVEPVAGGGVAGLERIGEDWSGLTSSSPAARRRRCSRRAKDARHATHAQLTTLRQRHQRHQLLLLLVCTTTATRLFWRLKFKLSGLQTQQLPADRLPHAAGNGEAGKSRNFIKRWRTRMMLRTVFLPLAMSTKSLESFGLELLLRSGLR
jgi:hypothetical protein